MLRNYISSLYQRLMPLMDAEGGGGGGNQEPPKGDGNQDPPKTYDEAYVKTLRQESAGYRTKLKDLETSIETKNQEFQANLLKALGVEPDPNKNYEKQIADAKDKAQKAEVRANDRLIRAEVKVLATELQLVSSDDVFMLMDRSNVKVDDEGNVSGVKEAIEALTKDRPWLKKSGAGATGGGGAPPSGGGHTEVNPWKKESFNLTKQAEILRTDQALAQRLKAEAGVR